MSVLNVVELTVDDLKSLIREEVTQTILDVFGDPDEGLELRDEFKVRLRRSLEKVRKGGETISAHQVATRLGLEW